MEKEIKISVIIPCYNQAQFLPATLDSVLSQTYPHWECIIVNDGSPDNTEEVALRYCAKDSRFIYLPKANGGHSSARNAGMDIASGDFIQLLDADDLISPTKFEVQLKSLEVQDADVIVCNFNYFRDDLNHQYLTQACQTTYDLSYEGFLYKWYTSEFVFPPHCALIKRTFLNTNTIRYQEGLKIFEDWIFWFSFALHNAQFSHQALIMAHYRRHDNNVTNDTNLWFKSFLQAPYEMQKLIPVNELDDFRAKIVEKQYQKCHAFFGESANAKKANSLEYSIGRFILYPLHLISGFIKKNIRKF